jgi:serpin B
MNDSLKLLGMKSAFDINADFTGITDGGAFISDVNQQTHITIDEKGVEAAAFTRIDFEGSEPPNDNLAEIILDRPFIFSIKSSTGTVLFVGIVNNPTSV